MDNQNLVIGLAGDVMIGRGVNSVISRRGYSYIWGDLLATLSNTDLNIANLETTLTTSNHQVFKTFNFKAGPDKIRSIIEANITIVNLANNHILDFGEEGLTETLKTLDAAGIKYVGAGKNNHEASKPVILSKNNISIGVLGFTDNEPGWKAGSFNSGVNYIDISKTSDRNAALQNIERLQKEADIIIVSIHWGPNMKEAPDKPFIDFAHEMIQHGAAIIHGHSAHNFQGIEVYDQKLIFYDTGDFVDDYVVDPYLRNDHSFFYQIELNKGSIIKAVLVPALISNCQVNLATEGDYKWSLKRMQHLSAKFETRVNDEGEILLTKKVTTMGN
jgi:poly-gamma-glutamate synthesis protein (capsule biosynthesis protein)